MKKRKREQNYKQITYNNAFERVFIVIIIEFQRMKKSNLDTKNQRRRQKTNDRE